MAPLRGRGIGIEEGRSFILRMLMIFIWPCLRPRHVAVWPQSLLRFMGIAWLSFKFRLFISICWCFISEIRHLSRNVAVSVKIGYVTFHHKSRSKFKFSRFIWNYWRLYLSKSTFILQILPRLFSKLLQNMSNFRHFVSKCRCLFLVFFFFVCNITT